MNPLVLVCDGDALEGVEVEDFWFVAVLGSCSRDDRLVVCFAGVDVDDGFSSTRPSVGGRDIG